jgi:Aminoglycoside-2''-adenylyltransferase
MLVGIGFDYGDLWQWEDFDPSRLSSLMCSFDAPWWVAGGRALDLWMGRQTRAHQDVDIAVLRADQKQLHEVFGGWGADPSAGDCVALQSPRAYGEGRSRFPKRPSSFDTEPEGLAVGALRRRRTILGQGDCAARSC